MSAPTVPGTGIMDMLPIPTSSAPVTDPHMDEVATDSQDTPSLGHALATAAVDHPELVTEGTGAAQVDHEEEVVDMGWNEPASEVQSPLVGGMKNEDLWVLVRRFNKQVYHLKETSTHNPGGLDLNIAEKDEFSPDKLRTSMERLYMTVIIGLMGFGKHIARLRSWRERRRTTYFCVAYTVAWFLDLLVPTFLALILVLILSPKSRDRIFPAAPLALVNSKTGGLQKPKSGVLGSTDSVTGAPENYKGEAVEQEASNFVTGIASVALASATGKHPQGDPPSEDGSPHDSVPDPTAMALSGANAKEKAAGKTPGATHDKTKVPMETMMWDKMRPAMHGIDDVSDTWERFGNALSSTPPFPAHIYRIRLASLVAPALLASFFVSSYMVVKGTTFGIGFGFFGDPIISPGLRWLNKTFPNWQKLLEIRNTILKGIPTNAQLTITLLRIGEINKAPLVPPPRSKEPPPHKAVDLTDEHLGGDGPDAPMAATREELDDAVKPQSGIANEADGDDVAASREHKHGKKGAKIIGIFKSITKTAVSTAIHTDELKAKAGSTPAKQRLGVVAKPDDNQTDGPVEFKCRHEGHKGHAYITSKATIPCIAFSTDKTIEKIGSRDREDLHPAWSIPVQDIKELQKRGGYGWKAKLVVGWALGREVQDGIIIIDRSGNKYDLTAMALRDELFNRLCAMGSQKWEAW